MTLLTASLTTSSLGLSAPPTLQENFTTDGPLFLNLPATTLPLLPDLLILDLTASGGLGCVGSADLQTGTLQIQYGLDVKPVRRRHAIRIRCSPR
ncbi:MAG TPA: hypothetical protein VNW90_04655 [Acetobacteraceae bacterium]|nr:hypothetical protein [Acetobacteraceae bacterium]